MRLPKKLDLRGILAPITLKSLGLCFLLFQAAVHAQEVPTFQVWDFGAVPRPFAQTGLLEMEPIREELAMSDAQKKEHAAIMERFTQQLQQARRETRDRTKFLEARETLVKAQETAAIANLTPAQRERVGEIQLQALGPFPFAWPEGLPASIVGPPLAERLKLSEDQDRRVRKIFEDGLPEIRKAASFPIVVDSKDGPPSTEAIATLVASPDFQAAKQNAANAGREASAGVIRRIEEVLTEGQRTAYHELLGKPFELSKLKVLLPGQDEQEFDRRMVANALGLGGQRADPSFSTKVEKPAYAGSSPHPRVLFDEAHHNFHTSGGRYKPFANLITSDGYNVIPNREKFSPEALQKGDILVIANALGAEGMGESGAEKPAFTEAECEAVRDWIKSGGSLLLISDHAPMGAAAECLAKSLGVSMNKGATADPSHSEDGDTSLVFSRQNQLLGDHPITRGRDQSERVNRVRTFTGTSVKGPEGSVPILKLADTAVDLAMGDEKPASAAGRAQGVAFCPRSWPGCCHGRGGRTLGSTGWRREVWNERPRDRQPPDGPQHHALALRRARAPRAAIEKGGMMRSIPAGDYFAR